MVARLLTPLAVLGLGALMLLVGLDVVSLTPGFAGAALFAVAGVGLLVSGLTQGPSDGGGP
jgi:hypothetical protein